MNPPTSAPQAGSVNTTVVLGGSSVGYHTHPGTALTSPVGDDQLPERLRSQGPDVIAANADSQLENGWWSGVSPFTANVPASGNWVCQTIRSSITSVIHLVQIAYEISSSPTIYTRQFDVVNWTAWVRVDGPTEVTLSAVAPFSGSVTLRRVNRMVYVDGAVSRASGSSATYTTCADTIPAGFLPAADTEMLGGVVFNTAVTYQFTALAAGDLQVRMSGADTTDLTINGHWRAA